jgi:hypothetical protein
MVFFEAGHKVTAEFEELYGKLAATRRAERRRPTEPAARRGSGADAPA